MTDIYLLVEFCDCHQLEVSFIHSLKEYGLIANSGDRRR